MPLFILLPLFGGSNPGKPSPVFITYQKANQFFNSADPTDITDSLALTGFEQVIAALEKTKSNETDTLLFQSYLKKGILLDVKSNNSAARDAYLRAAAIPVRNRLLGDSLLFRPYVYAGTNYFNLNNFDSANYYLIKAETLIKRYPQLPETERLYNTLGALHYIGGNYLQSKNYFSLALDLIRNRKPYDRVFALGLQSNIASSFYKMGDYAAALQIYNQIIKEKIPATYIYNGICMNMGKAYAAINQYREALSCFKKINRAETPGVLNELALTQYQLKHSDSADYYLNQVDLQQNSRLNILDIGINNLYRADMLVDQQRYMLALQQLQNAIAIFAGNFGNHDIYSNPSNFTGSYTYYRLFDALYKKARVFELLNRTVPNQQYLIASLDAYKAALTLLGFIEKSYDTDDAKLFLKKKSQDVYNEALQVCLRLYKTNPDGNYLEQAFMISERNKASVMAANLRQRKAAQGIDQSFLQAEKNIKFAIARLDVKSEQSHDNNELQQLAKEKVKYEIELSRLQKNLEQNNLFFKLKYEEDFNNAAELRRRLNSSQALFSFYMSQDALHVFAFTGNAVSYVKIDSLGGLQRATEAWINLLRSPAEGKRFDAHGLDQRLYNRLIKPMQLLAPGKSEWFIIPDGGLAMLPFESLPAGKDGKTLLETTTISYQFSSRFMLHPKTDRKGVAHAVDVLSFAPFIDAGAGYKEPGFSFIDQLPASGDEIADLDGTAFTGQKATKSAFLQQAGNFPVIHLATHAIADAQNPAASFIAFYPEKKQAAENCLYLEEIYGLNLDACKLVVISACETGKGELVNNEGVISLGRAFSYAGCGATINSLWKADDKATAEILKKFHVYLERGYTKSKALQKAKLDYINSDALYKSPAYWSNLVLSGNIEPVYNTQYVLPLLVAGIVLLGAIIFIAIIRRKKVDAFHNYL